MVGVDIGLYAENGSSVTPGFTYKHGNASILGKTANSATLAGQFRE
jgi:hypothetical protein